MITSYAEVDQVMQKLLITSYAEVDQVMQKLLCRRCCTADIRHVV
jgi:hypothetical protein